MEGVVIIRCRSQDQAIIESIFPDIEAEYERAFQKKIMLNIDTENFLPSETTGGVELLAHKGRIKISNTLEARLELIAQQLVPQIRTALFGSNLNRKFTD